jgi:hypothetical protein
MTQDRGRTLPFSGFKAAWRLLLDALGGVSAVERADITRGSASLLSRYGQVHESVFPPCDILFDIEKAVVEAGGRPEFLHAYADALGFVAVPKAAIEQPAETIDQSIGPASQAFGETLMKVGAAMMDGIVSPAEAKDLLPTVQRATAEICELQEAIAARAAKGGR